MSTSGIFGFRLHGEDKLSYNHADSYPDYLGRKIVTALKEISIAEMKRAFVRIQMVTVNEPPTEKQIKELSSYTDLSVSKQSTNDWYCLLRKAQGDIEAYIKHGLKYMLDGANFIKNSLYCEWGYIINLDDETLEIYNGFQKESDDNRYAIDEPDDCGYYHCKLLDVIPLKNIYNGTFSIDEYCKWIETTL